MMTFAVGATIYIFVLLILVDYSAQHFLSMKKGQANFLKGKTKYKIPPPVSGEMLSPRVVELMVVVHWDAARYHGDDTMNYITSIIYQAARLWHDAPHLGVDISIRVTGIIILEEDANDGLPAMADANLLLTKFCAWQEDRALSQKRPHDAAVLITRKNIHISENYNATGLAYMKGACDEGYRCAVVEDDSPMGTAITVAHELGHLLGMYHDSQFNACPDRRNLMSGYTVSGLQSVRWSTCSTQALLEFLRMKTANCLLDTQPLSSGHQLVLDPAAFPGDTYDANAQCQVALGGGVEACPAGRKWMICLHLKCLQPSRAKCVSTNRPPLDGTPCAINKWCNRGQCVDKPANHRKRKQRSVAMETSTHLMGDTPAMRMTTPTPRSTKTSRLSLNHREHL